MKRAKISNPSLKALLQRLVAYPATGKFHLLQMYYAVFMKPDSLVSAGSATQPFLVSSRNAPPQEEERCVTTLKTAV